MPESFCHMCGNPGPEFCETCKENLECPECEGTGVRKVCRNEHGEVDYLHGTPTEEVTDCTACGGEGYLV